MTAKILGEEALDLIKLEVLDTTGELAINKLDELVPSKEMTAL